MDTPETLDVLVLCASPVDVTPNLNLQQELAHLESRVRGAPIPVRLRRVYPPTFRALERALASRALEGFRPQVFHFLGHGEEDGLWLEDERGAGELVATARLRRLLAAPSSPLQLALVNACWSGTGRTESVCRALVSGRSPIRAAVGHDKPVADESAIGFAERFFEGLWDGEPVERARQRAANRLAEKGLPHFTEVVLEGDGNLVLGQGLAAGGPGQVEDGLPPLYSVPAKGFFCGRAKEYLEAAESLEDSQLTALGLWGIGGMGKTALATEFAERNAWRYPAGVAFVDIRGLPETERTVAGLAARALAALDPAAGGAADPALALVGLLQRQGPGLVVFDNLEDLPQAQHPALARLAQGLPRNGARLLVTARTRIAPFEGLPTTRALDLTRGLDDYNGAFYAHWVAEKQAIRPLADQPPRLEPGGRVAGRCASIARAVSGHPKMIEVAVALARKGLARMDRALDGLSGPLEAQLQALLATGLAQVGEEGRRIWSLLPLFPAGNAMPEALGVVTRGLDARAAGEDFDPSRADEALPDWAEAGLEQLEAAAFLDWNPERRLYTFHQTVLEQARREAGLDEETRVYALAWLLAFYGRFVMAHEEDYPAIERCIQNALPLMEAAWREQGEGHEERTLFLGRMADALGYFFIDRGLWIEGETWTERAVDLLRDAGNDRTLARGLHKRAQILGGRGDPEAARDALREATEAWERVGNRQGLAASLHELARIEQAQGNPAETRRLLRRSMAIDESLGNRQRLATSLHELARIEQTQGKLAKARRLLRRSIEIKESLDDRRGLASSLHELADIEHTQGNRAEARRLWERSLELSGALGDRAGKAITLCMLAQVEEMDGNWDRARTLARQAVDDLERIGHDQAADAREVLADIEAHAAAGGSEPSDSMEMLGELLTLPPQKGIRRVDQALASNPGPAKAVTLWLARATLCSRRHDASGLEQGLVRAREAVERVTGPERRSLEALVRQAESGVAELRQAGAAADSVRLHREGVERAKAGDLPSALERFEAALAASRAEGHGYNAAASLLAMGRALLLLERPAEALERLREGLAAAEPLGNDELLDALRQLFAAASQALRQPDGS